MNEKLKPCPFRICGEKKISLTISGEYYYNEYFMPCMGDRCPCYYFDGEKAICRKDGANFILTENMDDDDKTPPFIKATKKISIGDEVWNEHYPGEKFIVIGLSDDGVKTLPADGLTICCSIDCLIRTGKSYPWIKELMRDLGK